MPLQLFSIFLLILPALICADLVAKDGCQDKCGNLSIPYPFGVGSDCSMEPSFNITCDTSNIPPKAYLSIIDIDIQVLEINDSFVLVKYPNLVSVCYEGGNASYIQSMSVNLTGTRYTLSKSNRMTAIGCDDMVQGIQQSIIRIYLTDSYEKYNFVSSGCSALCMEMNDTTGVGYCPINETSPTNGCCQTSIYEDTYSDFVGAELVDLSGKLLRRKLFPCSYAFLQLDTPTVFSYPLYYLHNSTAFLNDNWASATHLPRVRLDWTVGADGNCSRAQLNSNTYACQDENSVCVDYYYTFSIDYNKINGEIDKFNVTRGYLCKCVLGYKGNPYLLGGCKKISEIAKPGCQDLCGELLIPFPFGVGRNCYLEPSFEIICNGSTPYLPIFNSEIIELNSSRVVVWYKNQPSIACYDYSSDFHRGSKTRESNLTIDLSGTQYTLSEENLITGVGCEDMVVGIMGQSNRTSFMRSSCATICFAIYNGKASCASNRTFSNGCCRAPVLRGTRYLEINLINLSGESPINMQYNCSFAFISHKNDLLSEIPLGEINRRPMQLALDWKIGTLKCEEAKQDSANFACRDNSDCIDFDAALGGYLCNCSKGYRGNPYLNQGCRDIDECDDNTANACISNSNCINDPGSYHCECPKGYSGDGRKDGTGCHQLPPKMMIILIGIGSALGFLLLLVMCFWLYKVFQKRKEKRIKAKYFKRNGGLLLEQQTNEGALGKTKVFPICELELATDHFNESRILGHGGQGAVYKGMLLDGKIVAIKKSMLVEENQLEQFINEVAILSQINHRNVVKLLGCCLETEVPLLVYEFMPNGTLYDLIHDASKEFPFPWSMRLKVAVDIAGALAYLHSASSMPIYHRDIKSTNLLLDEKYVVKVADFGMSRSVAADKTHLTTMVIGTIGYLDPEYFQSNQFTEKCDVYSFGVVLVELLTGKKPIFVDNDEQQRGLASRFLTCIEENCLDTILDPQVLEQDRKEEVILVASLARRCLNFKGKMRPTMKEVATELESFRISQMSTIAKDESEDDVRGIPMMISDIDYTWTGSYESVAASSSDTLPLVFSTE